MQPIGPKWRKWESDIQIEKENLLFNLMQAI